MIYSQTLTILLRSTLTDSTVSPLIPQHLIVLARLQIVLTSNRKFTHPI